MKLSEMAKKAKNKLIETFRGKREDEKASEKASMNAQTGQERLQEEKTDISAQDNEKGKGRANIEPTEGKEGNEKYVIGADLANGKDMTGYIDGFRPYLGIVDECHAHKADIKKADLQEALKRVRDIQKITGVDEETAEQLALVIVNMGEAINKAFDEVKKQIIQIAEELTEMWRKIGKTEAQIRKEELWKRYYEEKAKMSNNERRRRGIPMVRRPKRQQYRTKKRKNEKSESESPETDQEEDQEEESGQQDDGK